MQDVVIGKIIAPFGIRGEVKAIVLTDFPERFSTGKKIKLKLSETERREVLIEAKRPHQDGILLKLEGVKTREDADLLRSVEVVVDESEVGRLSKDHFYIFDIIGLKVITDDGREQGEVVEVLQSGANDVYITSTGLCIPALKTVVTKIDLDERVMVIHPVPGLLPGE